MGLRCKPTLGLVREQDGPEDLLATHLFGATLCLAAAAVTDCGAKMGDAMDSLRWIRMVVITGLLWLAVSAGSAAAQTSAPSATQALQESSPLSLAAVVPLCGRDYYENVNGVCVHRPSRNPKGATAKCRDGTYSYSRHASGTCSHHGGVARWIRHP